MSGTLVLPRDPSKVSITSRFGQSFISRAHSGKTQRRSRGGHTWLVHYGWENLERTEYSELLRQIIDQAGQYETFQIVLPVHGVAGRGSWAGAPLVNGGSQAGHSINLDGFTPSSSNVIRGFDYFKFANHSKVYCATADKNSDGGGLVVAAFRPDLVSSPLDNDAVTFASVPMTVALATDVSELPLRAPIIGSLELDFEEVW